MQIIYLGDAMFKLFQNRKLERNENTKQTNQTKKIKQTKQAKQDKHNTELVKSLDNNISFFTNIFKNDQTLIIREFQNKHLKAAQCCIIYIDGMVNTEIINENIIQPILRNDLSEDI